MENNKKSNSSIMFITIGVGALCIVIGIVIGVFYCANIDIDRIKLYHWEYLFTFIIPLLLVGIFNVIIGIFNIDRFLLKVVKPKKNISIILNVVGAMILIIGIIASIICGFTIQVHSFHPWLSSYFGGQLYNFSLSITLLIISLDLSILCFNVSKYIKNTFKDE